MNVLPKEIILGIFSWLPPEDLACRVALVCKEWNLIAETTSLWVNADLRYAKNTENEFIQVLHFAPCLRLLDYSGYTTEIPVKVVTGLLNGVANVKAFSLQTTNKVLSYTIERVLLHYKDYLETLTLFVNSHVSNLVACYTDGDSDPERTSQDLRFLSVIEEFVVLRTLVLRGVWRCHSKNTIVGAGCPKLENLDFCDLITDFYEEHECHFFVNLIKNKRTNLKYLGLTPYVHPCIMQEVAKLRNLRAITISLAALSVIQDMELLENLHIRGHGREHFDGRGHFNSREFATSFIYSNCARFGNLKNLLLDNLDDYDNKITPALAATCKRLENLTISAGTTISSKGYTNLFRELSNLRRLQINDNFSLGLRHVQALPDLLPGLLYLDVRGCFGERGLPPKLASKLQHKMSLLRILCDAFVKYQKNSYTNDQDLPSTDQSDDE